MSVSTHQHHTITVILVNKKIVDHLNITYIWTIANDAEKFLYLATLDTISLRVKLLLLELPNPHSSALIGLNNRQNITSALILYRYFHVKYSDVVHILVPLVDTLTARIRYATSTGSTQPPFHW